MNLGNVYLFLVSVHHWVSRIGMGAALIMFAIGVYIGLLRHGDVTRWYRKLVYGVAGLMALQAVMGLVMYLIGGRPFEEIHLIYGFGAALALPFFIFVEVTAKKRPAMGSYLWGFGVLAGILLRAMMTGAAG